MSSNSVRRGAIWWTLTKERQAWCNLQVKRVIHVWALCEQGILKRRYINILPFLFLLRLWRNKSHYQIATFPEKKRRSAVADIVRHASVQSPVMQHCSNVVRFIAYNTRTQSMNTCTRAKQLLRWATVPVQSGPTVGGRGCCAPMHGGAEFPPNTVAWTEAYIHTKWHPNPSNRLATIHQRYRQTDMTDRETDRQQSDSTGRTVLQTVDHKMWKKCTHWHQRDLNPRGRYPILLFICATICYFVPTMRQNVHKCTSH